MTGDSLENIRRESFRLFEEGKYTESLDLCRAAGTARPDPQLAILAARNLFNLRRFDEAEAYVRDMIRTMPESSYLHSFLGRILEERNDDTAVVGVPKPSPCFHGRSGGGRKITTISPP